MTSKTLDYLEGLESQLLSFKLKAIENGDTEIAALLHKFRYKIVQIQNEVKSELEASE